MNIKVIISYPDGDNLVNIDSERFYEVIEELGKVIEKALDEIGGMELDEIDF